MRFIKQFQSALMFVRGEFLELSSGTEIQKDKAADEEQSQIFCFEKKYKINKLAKYYEQVLGTIQMQP